MQYEELNTAGYGASRLKKLTHLHVRSHCWLFSHISTPRCALFLILPILYIYTLTGHRQRYGGGERAASHRAHPLYKEQPVWDKGPNPSSGASRTGPNKGADEADEGDNGAEEERCWDGAEPHPLPAGNMAESFGPTVFLGQHKDLSSATHARKCFFRIIKRNKNG